MGVARSHLQYQGPAASLDLLDDLDVLGYVIEAGLHNAKSFVFPITMLFPSYYYYRSVK